MAANVAAFTSLVTALLLSTGAFAADVDHCVECHGTEQLPISLGHSFDDWRASAWYRMAVAKNLLRKFHAETSGPSRPIRLAGEGKLAYA